MIQSNNIRSIFKKSLTISLFLVSISLSTRLYVLPEIAIYTADEEYQSTYAQTIVKDFHPIWIGVSAGDTGFYLGPYFTYLTALIQYLGNNDPLISNYFAAAIGSLTSILVFHIGKNIGSSRVGIYAALIYAFSPLMVYLDQRYWNPNLAPFLTCLFLLALINVKKQKWWIFIISFCLGAFWHIHLSLVPISILAVYPFWKQKLLINLNQKIIVVLILIIMFIPLIIFDYNHDWSNILTPIRLIQNGGRSLALISNINIFGTTLLESLYLKIGTNNVDAIRTICPNISFSFQSFILKLIAISPLIIYWNRYKNRQNESTKYLSLASLILTFTFILYPGEVFGYYLAGFLPLYFLIISLLLSAHRIRHFLLLIFMFFSLNTLVNVDRRNGLAAKHELINQVIASLGNHSFTLQENGTCHRYGGWRYLFSSYGKTPATSSADPSLSWLYPDQVGEIGEYLVIVSPTDESAAPESPLVILNSGGYTAYITKWSK